MLSGTNRFIEKDRKQNTVMKLTLVALTITLTGCFANTQPDLVMTGHKCTLAEKTVTVNRYADMTFDTWEVITENQKLITVKGSALSNCT